MQVITTTGVDMMKLGDYLFREVPTFGRTVESKIYTKIARDDCGALTQSGDNITISFADDIPVGIIQLALNGYSS